MADDKKELTLGERVINWAKAVSIVGAPLLAIYAAALKGEPEAELAYEHLAEMISKDKAEKDRTLAELNTKIERSSAFVKGFVEGQQSKNKPRQLEKMSRKLEKLAPKIVCRKGFRLEKDHCVAIPQPKTEPAAATRPGPTREALNSDKPKAAAKPKPDPKSEMVKIKTYIVASRKGWSMGEQLAAMKLSKLAQRERWTFEKYVKGLEALHSRINDRKERLPRTLKKLKAFKQNQEQTKAQMKEEGF